MILANIKKRKVREKPSLNREKKDYFAIFVHTYLKTLVIHDTYTKRYNFE